MPKAELGQTNLAISKEITRKSLLSKFKKSPPFLDLYREAFAFHLMPHSSDELHRFSQRFRGALFEKLAFMFVREAEIFPRKPLSPQETWQYFYNRLFPNARIVHHLFSSYSLNIPVPDGICFQDRKRESVSQVLEYTLSGNPSIFKSKVKAFVQYREEFSDVFGDAELIFVVPKIRTERLIRAGDASFVHLPINRRQFDNLTNEVYQHLRPGDNDQAALADVQKRTNEQRDNFISRFIQREELPPEALLYLSKIG